MLGTIAAIAYGILAIVGGVFGYAKAKSKPSLISGLASGILLVIGGIGQQQGTSWGLWLSVIVAVVLIIVFAIRLAKTRKFMPAGLMLIAGIAALIGMLITIT
ncbi:MAG: hypothetical protein HC769_08565 [Cyanobacteria bacterium CRU_2_1]|nr:hypothetical protein [Cyanobacteria bacterium RU_5_0]NJR58896.1 hypothetical protein [Cyanobacteria bacterium CRU_2_1]